MEIWQGHTLFQQHRNIPSTADVIDADVTPSPIVIQCHFYELLHSWVETKTCITSFVNNVVARV